MRGEGEKKVAVSQLRIWIHRNDTLLFAHRIEARSVQVIEVNFKGDGNEKSKLMRGIVVTISLAMTTSSHCHSINNHITFLISLILRVQQRWYCNRFREYRVSPVPPVHPTQVTTTHFFISLILSSTLSNFTLYKMPLTK